MRESEKEELRVKSLILISSKIVWDDGAYEKSKNLCPKKWIKFYLEKFVVKIETNFLFLFLVTVCCCFFLYFFLVFFHQTLAASPNSLARTETLSKIRAKSRAMIMALEQTLTLSSSLLSKNSIFSTFRNDLRITSFSTFLSHPNAPKHLRFATRFPKCSAMENYINYSVAYPKPSEIPWKKELSNSVSLIGTVGMPVELKHLTSGKDVAWTRLAVWKSSTETSWYSSIVSFRNGL